MCDKYWQYREANWQRETSYAGVMSLSDALKAHGHIDGLLYR